MQPKNSIYGKRANMKPPREKLRQRKESNNSDTDDVIMSAESALLMEQILEEEKVCSRVLGPVVLWYSALKRIGIFSTAAERHSKH